MWGRWARWLSVMTGAFVFAAQFLGAGVVLRSAGRVGVHRGPAGRADREQEMVMIDRDRVGPPVGENGEPDTGASRPPVATANNDASE